MKFLLTKITVFTPQKLPAVWYSVIHLLCMAPRTVFFSATNISSPHTHIHTYREEGGPVFLHSFSFSDYFPSGVDSLLYHHSLNILIVGAAPSEGEYDCMRLGICY